MTIARFEPEYSAATVEDLRERLKRTRWPEVIPNSGWEYGTDSAFLHDICGYWAETFDWKRELARISAIPHRTISPSISSRCAERVRLTFRGVLFPSCLGGAWLQHAAMDRNAARRPFCGRRGARLAGGRRTCGASSASIDSLRETDPGKGPVSLKDFVRPRLVSGNVIACGGRSPRAGRAS